MPMRNAEIAAAMEELGTLYELDGAVRYRGLAYKEAGRVIRQSPVSVEELALAGGAGLIAHMDADFSHDPGDLPRLLAATERADLVLGSRYVVGGGVADWGPTRRLISRGGSAYARAMLGVGIRDLTGGFKVFRREVLERIGLEAIPSLGYAFQVETTFRAIRAGFRVIEVPIVFRDRRVGESKMNGSIVAEAAFRIPMMRLARRP